MFFNREAELAFLNSLLERTRPTPGQMILLYGRRRVGKTVLARHWAASTGLPTLYWAAEREPAALQRRKLYASALGLSITRAPARRPRGSQRPARSVEITPTPARALSALRYSAPRCGP